MQKSNCVSFFVGLLFGATIGGAAAYLFSPADSEKVANELKDNVFQLVGSSGEHGEKLKAAGARFVDEQRTRLEEAVAEGREAAKAKRAELQQMYDQATSSKA